MKKLLLGIIVALTFATGCEIATENAPEPRVDKQEKALFGGSNRQICARSCRLLVDPEDEYNCNQRCQEDLADL